MTKRTATKYDVQEEVLSPEFDVIDGKRVERSRVKTPLVVWFHGGALADAGRRSMGDDSVAERAGDG